MDSTRRDRPKSRPYAAIPHDLAEDPRLTPLDLAVVRVLLKYARGDDRCWVLVAVIAAAVRRTRRTVQLAIGRLRAAGWVGVEPAANPSGRAFVLAWRAQSAAEPGAQPAAPERSEKEKPRKTTGVVVAQAAGGKPENPQTAVDPAWPALALEEAAGRLAAGKPIRTTVEDYAAGIVIAWARQGKATPIYAGKKPARSASREESVTEYLARRAGEAAEADRAAADRRAVESGLRGRWEALPPAARDEIVAAVRAANPGLRWGTMLEPLYLAALAAGPG